MQNPNVLSNNNAIHNGIIQATHIHYGARGSVVVKALCYKPEGSGFDSR
jgi:hypothetical protein